MGKSHCSQFLFLLGMNRADFGTHRICANTFIKGPIADESSWTRFLNFHLSFHLNPYFVYTSSKGSGESVYTNLRS